MVTTPIISFTADVNGPDLYNDVYDLPNPFTLNVLLGISNTHPSSTLYFKASIVSPPADYSVSSTNLGSVAPGANGFFTFKPTRAQPSLTAGEYDETLTLRIDAYTDSGYSVPYANKTLSVTIHHFNHTDAAWTVIEHADFTSDYNGWTVATNHGLENTHFYSSPSSLCLSYIGSSNYQPGYAQKTINTGAKSKARIIMHIYYNPSYCIDDDIRITVGGVVKKPRTLPLPQNTWTRLSYNFPVNTNVLTELWCNGYTYHYPYYWIDEIWVIGKT